MTTRNFDPVKVVAYYQARCTNCGQVEADYGDYSAWSDKSTPVDMVTDHHGWVEIDATDELLCLKCQTNSQFEKASEFEKAVLRDSQPNEDE